MRLGKTINRPSGVTEMKTQFSATLDYTVGQIESVSLGEFVKSISNAELWITEHALGGFPQPISGPAPTLKTYQSSTRRNPLGGKQNGMKSHRH